MGWKYVSVYRRFHKNLIWRKWWRIFFKVDVYYKKLHDPHNDLHFFPEKMKHNEEVEKLVANFYDKRCFYSHEKFKASIKSWSVLKKVYRVIKLNHEAWLKPYL